MTVGLSSDLLRALRRLDKLLSNKSNSNYPAGNPRSRVYDLSSE
jgi:hypothetical protein